MRLNLAKPPSHVTVLTAIERVRELAVGMIINKFLRRSECGLALDSTVLITSKQADLVANEPEIILHCQLEQHADPVN